MLSTPAGISARSTMRRASSVEVNGACGEAFSAAVFPAAMAGVGFQMAHSPGW